MNITLRLALLGLLSVFLLSAGTSVPVVTSADLIQTVTTDLRARFIKIGKLSQADRIAIIAKLIYPNACPAVKRYYRNFAIALRQPHVGQVSPVLIPHDSSYPNLHRFGVAVSVSGGKSGWIHAVYNYNLDKLELCPGSQEMWPLDHWRAGHDDEQYMRQRQRKFYEPDC